MTARHSLHTAIGASAAIAALVVGLVWGTRVAGGSDSYCYIEQAERWAFGTMTTPQAAIFAGAPWLDPWLPLAPTGFVPSTSVPGAIAPICPAGLALTMVPFRLVFGREGVHLVVPILGALTVWLTFLLGREIAGARGGALAAPLVATSPIFLYQVVQPMSDVPAAAWWALAAWLVARGSPRALVGAGLATAAAVLTRPNLVPLAAVLVCAVWTRPQAGGALARTRDALRFCLGALPGALAVAGIQHLLYGAATRSGYGGLAHLFSTAHVAPNLSRYTRWALETHTPVLLLAPLALLVRPPGRADAETRQTRWVVLTWLALIVLVIASYLPYVVFDGWTYLRFLLPALPFTMALVAAVLSHAAGRLPRRWDRLALVAIGLLLCAVFVRTAYRRDAFVLRTYEHKFRVAGEHLGRALEPRAVVLAIRHSGSVRYYGDRTTVLWDAIPADSLDRTLAYLEARGLTPYLLLERWEEPDFRARFGAASALGALDWPPRIDFGRELRLYATADRARYFAGERTPMVTVPLN